MRTSVAGFRKHAVPGLQSRQAKWVHTHLRIRRTEIQITLAIFLAALSAAGCAKIAEPQPPEVRIPLPATDLAARQVSDFIVLTVSKPERNTNGSEATTLRSVDIYRLSEDGNAKDVAGVADQGQFAKKALLILSIPAYRFSEYLSEKTFTFQDRFSPDPSVMYSHSFRYAVRFINDKKQRGGLSNQVSITPVPIPLPPIGLSATESQDSISLKWTAPSENMDGSKPPRIAGYNIYRTEDPKQFPSNPVNPEPVQATGFEDLNFRFDTTYYYEITTVGGLQRPRPESLRSQILPVSTKDTFPPDPPKDFSAILQGDTVILLWAPSPSADVDGYRISRQEQGGAERKPVQTELIRALSFRDSKTEAGKKYEYEIRAVDTHGNESVPVKTEMEQR